MLEEREEKKSKEKRIYKQDSVFMSVLNHFQLDVEPAWMTYRPVKKLLSSKISMLA